MTDETTSEAASDTRFKPGQSGNPSGKPKGARNKFLMALEAIGEAEAEEIVRATIAKAKEGDAQAARTILERVWPARKGARMTFDLPAVTSAQDLPVAIAAVNQQAADGEISPDEAALIVSLLDAHRKAIETNDLAARLAALEERLAKK